MKTRLPSAFAGLIAVFIASDTAAIDRIDQLHLNQMVANGEDAFAYAFEAGDELTEHTFDASEGVGARIGEGRRFTRIPRADLAGQGEWATHEPRREGGANATSCIACHNAPVANGAGDVALNVLVDPAHTGDPALYLERNTLHLFALGAPQRLAEEMSMELWAARDAATAAACTTGAAEATLSAKGVAFGTIAVSRTVEDPCDVAIDYAGLRGVDQDLIVKPFGWKGSHATIRDFTRDAAHNELGLQAVELIGQVDGDHDGVIDELTVGDMTALAIYMAALERPVSLKELDDLGLEPLAAEERAAIVRGEAAFAAAECGSCHVPMMHYDDPTFSEPSATPGFVDTAFPAGTDPLAHGLTAATAITFDMTADQPNNRIERPDGTFHLLGALETDAEGRPAIRWYSDLRRHDMGPELADPSDPLGIGASMFLTRSLAGVGSTGPWLHDGRATTLDEAIRMHGGEATASRDAYLALDEGAQADLVAFLSNLVIRKFGEEE